MPGCVQGSSMRGHGSSLKPTHINTQKHTGNPNIHSLNVGSRCRCVRIAENEMHCNLQTKIKFFADDLKEYFSIVLV